MPKQALCWAYPCQLISWAHYDVYQIIQPSHCSKQASYVLQHLWRCLSSDFDLIGPYFSFTAVTYTLNCTCKDFMYLLVLYAIIEQLILWCVPIYRDECQVYFGHLVWHDVPVSHVQLQSQGSIVWWSKYQLTCHQASDWVWVWRFWHLLIQWQWLCTLGEEILLKPLQ